MKNYKQIITRKTKETVKEAIARIEIREIYDRRDRLGKKYKKAFIIKASQNAVLLQYDEEPDEIIATYNGRLLFKSPGSDLFDNVLREVRRRMLRKDIDPECDVYTQSIQGHLIDVTKELKNS